MSNNNHLPPQDTDLSLYKVPPNNLEAEEAVLSACIMSAESLLEAIEILKPDHFYRSANKYIFQAMVDLYKNGQPVDLVMLANELKQKKQLDTIGGATYLSKLVDEIPMAVNVPHYATIIREKAILRIAIQKCNTIATDCFNDSMSATNIIDNAQKEILSIEVENSDDNSYSSMAQIAEKGIDVLDERSKHPGTINGLPTGFKDIDNLTWGLQKSDLIIIAARPSMGKSALALNIARHIAIDKAEPVPVAIFSLEMSKEQLLFRLMSDMAKINSQQFRSGYFSPSDWSNMVSATDKITNAPIFIDDNGGLSIDKVQRRSRKMFKKHGLGLIIVDYLQLMEGNQTGSRDREVASITGGLKAIAKELNIPVVALSQLNRSLETRSNKRPQLSDLRECLATESTLLLTSSGVQSNMSSHMLTYGLNTKTGGIELAKSKNIPKKENKTIYVRLSSGRFIQCTKKHPILTDVGWTKAKDLTKDHAIACIHKIKEPKGTIKIPSARWLGWMLGNGSMLNYSSPTFICSDIAVANGFINETEKLFGLTPKIHKHWSKKVYQYDITAGHVRTSAGNPCKNWLRENDMWGKKAPQKEIPQWFLEQADNKSLSEIVGGLVDTDGSIPLFTKCRPAVKYSTTSLKMAHQYMWCLSRLGIFGRIDKGYFSDKATTNAYSVIISEGIEVEKFRKAVTLYGIKGKKLMSASLSKKGSNFGNRLGVWVGKELVRHAESKGFTPEKLGYRYQKKRISRNNLKFLLDKIDGYDNKKIAWLANDNIYWDRLKYIEDGGEVAVFDRSVPSFHNFAANGIIVHNSGSIENDADIVSFIYRDEVYNPEEDNPNRGTAEIIIAKHRNGPTDFVKLAFVKRYSSFYDIQEEDDHFPMG